MKTVRQSVYGFNTKHKQGFVQSEIDVLLGEYHNISLDRFNHALVGVTCMKIDDDVVIYHHDVANALLCAVEDRGLHDWEWD